MNLFTPEDFELFDTAKFYIPLHTRAFAEHAANTMAKQAEALKVLVKALAHIQNGCLVPPDGGSPYHPEDDIETASTALIAAAEILGDV